MVKSIRRRLLIWYAAVLAAVIAGFALTLYIRARQSALEQIDEQLNGAAEYITATLKNLPPPEIEGRGEGPFGLPPFEAAGPLSQEQRAEIERLEDEVGARLDQILTPEQNEQLEQMRTGEPPRLPRRPPGDRPPPGTGRPGARGPRIPSPAQMRDRVLGQLGLPPSLAPREGDRARDRAYFVVWRPDGTILKADPQALETAPPATPVFGAADAGRLQYRQRGPAREAYRQGPHATAILVGKPVERELGELARFGWRLAGTGFVALAMGLAGGWFISRGIVRPIERISATAAALSAANLSGRIDTGSLDDELVGLARVLNETFARLEAEFARQARFTADASHELRTPVALLHSQIELALKRQRSPEEYREALETCARAAARLRSLLDGLLTLARADAGHLELALQPIDFVGIVEEVVEAHQGEAQRAQIALAHSLPSAPVRVNADGVFLARLLANLLSNALRHTPSGGRVEISLSVDHGDAILKVIDTGSGIPLENQPRIFERFYRVDKARSRATGGSGLGLAICQSIVEAHQGSITFTSTPGAGTTFVVRIPVLHS